MTIYVNLKVRRKWGTGFQKKFKLTIKTSRSEKIQIRYILLHFNIRVEQVIGKSYVDGEISF